MGQSKSKFVTHGERRDSALLLGERGDDHATYVSIYWEYPYSVSELYLRTKLFMFRLQDVTIELCFEFHRRCVIWSTLSKQTLIRDPRRPE